MGPIKTCTGCGEEYPATTEFFHLHKLGKYGLNPRCKKCRIKSRKKQYKRNFEKETEQHRSYRENNKKKIYEYDKKFYEKFRSEHGIDYSFLHKIIKRNKTKPEACSICNKYKKLQLCSINHTYTRNPNDWIYLCSECHALFDKIINKRDDL